MDKQSLTAFITMTFSTRFIQIRKEHQLTQQEMTDKCGMHITQDRCYEAEQAQPSIEILKKIALTNTLQLKFEAVSQISDEDQRTIQSLIDGMILKHTATQLRAAK